MSNSLKIKYVFGALEIAKRNREGRELEIIKSANRMVEQLENELADKEKQLAEARAEIERLKINTRCDLDLLAADTVQMNKMQDEIEAIVFVKKKAVEEIAFLNQEIERKDKLIEQMRGLIRGYRIEHKEWCGHDPDNAKNCTCGLSELIRAALSAAERGE